MSSRSKKRTRETTAISGIGSTSDIGLAFDKPTKRQKISNSLFTNGSSSSSSSVSRWQLKSNNNVKTNKIILASFLNDLNNKNNQNNNCNKFKETQERKKRLQQFLTLKKMASSNDKSESLRKQTVFQATKNKQRQDEENKADLQRYMKKVDASKPKILKDLEQRLKKKRLEKLKKEKNFKMRLKKLAKDKNGEIDAVDVIMNDLKKQNDENSKNNKMKKKEERIYNDESKFDEDDLLIDNEYENIDINQHNNNKKEIKLIDHSQIDYPKLRKNLYVESPEIKLMSWSDIELYRKNLLNNCSITVCSKQYDIKPIFKWTQCGLSNNILKILNKYSYNKPFPVQSQSIPIIMSGRDLICIASTGSGKTLSYILPLIRHINMNYNNKNNRNDIIDKHPKSIILCPTRELTQQIFNECKRFINNNNNNNNNNIRCVSIYGGVSITEQINNIRRGCDILIATPGRLIELLCTNCGRLLDIKYVSYFVLDEADRLFDLGFESQITSIIQNVRPDKQLLMFSATFPKKIEKIAMKYFLCDDKTKKNKKNKNLIQLSIGNNGISAPCENVAQFVYIVDNEQEKFKSLLRLLGEWYGRGNILIFVDTRNNVDLLFSKLCDSGYFSLILHGGINQIDRDYTIIDFKNKNKTILICTSIASRGLDVDDLKIVINYTPPHHYEDYIHRIGRTGRGNQRGVSYTFINRENLTINGNELKSVPIIIKAMKKSSIKNNKLGDNITNELLLLEKEYYKQINEGKQTFYRNQGYNGKGYKYDKFENGLKKQEIERQKYVYGEKEELQIWNLNKTDDVTKKDDKKINENKDNQISSTTASSSTTTTATNIQTATNDNPLKRDLGTLKKALLAAKKKKKEIEKKNKKMSDKKGKIKYDETTSKQLIKKSMAKAIEKEKKKHEKQTRDRVESIAKMISKEIDHQQPFNTSLTNGTLLNKDNNNGKTSVYTLDINNYPTNVRKTITYKGTLNPLRENYNVRIIQKGQFIANPRLKQKDGEIQPLHLEISGTNESDVLGAIKELKQVLYQESSKTNYSHNKYNKYSVV